MKKIGIVKNNFIINVVDFPDNHVPISGQMDVTNIVGAGIGIPVIDGIVMPMPSKWHTLKEDNSGWEITPEKQAEKDAIEAVNARSAEINDARETAGIKDVTIEQAHDFIDSRLDAAITAAEVKDAIRTILKKMIPYILN